MMDDNNRNWVLAILPVIASLPMIIWVYPLFFEWLHWHQSGSETGWAFLGVMIFAGLVSGWVVGTTMIVIALYKTYEDLL